MNATWIKSLIVTAGVLSVPTLSSAANSPAYLSTCVKAFMDSLTSQNSAVKLRESHYVDYGSVNSRVDELTLTARDAHDNHTVARAVCTVGVNGEVVNLRAEPVGGLDSY